MKKCSYCGKEYPDTENKCAADGNDLVALERAQPPRLPGQPIIKRRNYYAIASLTCAIIGFFVMGSNDTPTQFRVMTICAPLVGILAVALGICGLHHSRVLRAGRVPAIIGIILGCVVVSTISLPVLKAEQQAVHRQSAKRLVGRPAPGFTLSQATDSSSITDKSLKGSVYILAFWPSPDAFPGLENLYQKHKTEGLKVYAVIPSHVRQNIADFVRTQRITVPILVDSDKGDVPATYFVPAGVEAVLVGKDGTVISVFFTASYTGEIEDAVKNALSGR